MDLSWFRLLYFNIISSSRDLPIFVSVKNFKIIEAESKLYFLNARGVSICLYTCCLICRKKVCCRSNWGWDCNFFYYWTIIFSRDKNWKTTWVSNLVCGEESIIKASTDISVTVFVKHRVSIWKPLCHDLKKNDSRVVRTSTEENGLKIPRLQKKNSNSKPQLWEKHFTRVN